MPRGGSAAVTLGAGAAASQGKINDRKQTVNNKNIIENRKNLLNSFFLQNITSRLCVLIISIVEKLMSIIHPGDLVTLRGMSKIKEKPLGIVKRTWSTNDLEIIWLNKPLAKRYALHTIVPLTKIEVVSGLEINPEA
jgi:hypothetical protein